MARTLFTSFIALAIAATRASADPGTIVQMFGWSWDSIALECTQFLGPAGYAYAQVSPPQETISGDQWWTDYQPVSYTLTGKRGDRASFQNMIQTCHEAGVKILSDTVMNHMSGMDSGTGTAGTQFEHYSYPGLYDNSSFHFCGLEPGNNIVNYDNRLEVQTCQLDGLADLATDTAPVQATLAGYVSDLLSLGVDGLRLDACKHMASDNVKAILSQVNGRPSYITQEVIWGAGEPIQPSEYVMNGNVQEFRYTSFLQNAFTGGGLSLLTAIPQDGWLNSTDANAFVANHDTERGGNSLNYSSPNGIYTLATAFMLAYPYGAPTVLSSYEFSSYDQGPPNNGSGSCYGAGGVNGWLCQHRWPAVVGATALRNTVMASADASTPISNVATGTQNQLAFSRGASAFAAFNNEDDAWSNTFATGLPVGSYCDVWTGPSNATGCSGATVTVGSNGSAQLNVPPRAGIMIHTGDLVGSAPVAPSSAPSSVPGPTLPTNPAPSSTNPAPSSSSAPPPPSTISSTDTPSSTAPPGTVSLLFSTTYEVEAGAGVYVVGSIPELGTWTPASGVALSSESSYPTWSGTVDLAPGTQFEYKYVVVGSDGTVTWEADPNRQGVAPQSGGAVLDGTWQ